MNTTIKVRDDVVVKLLRIEDAEKLFETIQLNKEHLSEWLGWLNDDRSVEDTEKYIIGSKKRFEDQEGVDFSIWQNDALIGGIGLYPWDKSHKKTSIAYWLTKEAEGKGIMTDCLRKVIEFAFNEMAVNRIEISVATKNIRSAALPKKFGFKFEGTLREANWLYDHFVDLEVYSLLLSEWRK